MNEAQARLLGEPRSEMRGDASRAESVVENRFDDYVLAFDVVIDGKRKVWNAHAMVSVVNGMDACEISKGVECRSEVRHEVVKNPFAALGIKVLRFDDVEFGKGRESHAFHVPVRSGGPSGGLSRPPSHRRGFCLLRRDARGGRVPARATPAACMHRHRTQATTKGSPSPEPSARRPSRLFPASVPTFAISPFADIIAKPTERRKGVRER